MEFDMGVLMSATKGKHVVTLEIGVSEAGEPIYTVSWYNGRRWDYTPRFNSFKDAYRMYKMILRMA